MIIDCTNCVINCTQRALHAVRESVMPVVAIKHAERSRHLIKLCRAKPTKEVFNDLAPLFVVNPDLVWLFGQIQQFLQCLQFKADCRLGENREGL